MKKKKKDNAFERRKSEVFRFFSLKWMALFFLSGELSNYEKAIAGLEP